MTFKEHLKKLNRRTYSPRPAGEDVEKVHLDADHKLYAQENPDLGSKGLLLLNDPRISIEEPEDTYTVDVIFVHGLNGDWAKTWTHKNGTFWPKDLLPHAIPGARIFSYGYPSQIIATKSVAEIRDFAKHLYDDIAIPNSAPSRPIIYVCHSLGGIVVKQALITAHQLRESTDVWSRCKAVIFMGTPHHGSSYATYGKIFLDIVNVTMRLSLTDRLTGRFKTELLKTLAKGNSELEGISKEFRSLIESSAIQIISFYETEAHPWTKYTIVDKSSAELGVGREQFKPLYLNHQDLCRFSGPDDTNYIKVSNAIKSEASKEPSTDVMVASSLWTDYSYDETEKACASLLNVVDVADYESRLDSRVEGTLEWVLQEPQYQSWSSSPEIRLMWITGYAGSGKTVLASFMSRHLIEARSHTLVCKFFCDEKAEEYRDPLVLLKSIIFQIVDKRRALWRLVKKACDAGSFKVFSQFDALWNLFVKMVRAERKYSFVIIVDAIDELNRADQSKVITRISELLFLENTTSVKFFMTSRPNSEIALDFESCSRHLVQLSLENSKEQIDADIRSIVHYRLERMVKTGACMPPVREYLETALVSKADQTFLWIKFVLPLLEQHRLLLESEAKIILSTIPVTLTSLYKHLLLDIPEEERFTAAKILRLLVVCDRPLTGDEIGTLVTITSDHRSMSSLTTEHLLLGQESVQALLGPLIRVHSSHIELVHQSLKDYLINLSSGTLDAFADIFGVDMIRDKKTVFAACSMYLSLEDFEHDLYALLEPTENDFNENVELRNSPHSSSYESDLETYGLDLLTGQTEGSHILADEVTWAAMTARFKLFDYAALHWAIDFAKCGTEAPEERERALSLCNIDSAQATHWFRYFWHKQAHLEPFPPAVDLLMLISYFGHTHNLQHLLHESSSPYIVGRIWRAIRGELGFKVESGNIDPESLSRALYWAAREGHGSCVRLLLQQAHCDPQYSKVRNQTPLSAASQFGHLECVSLLLKDSRVAINTQDDYHRTALSRAIGNNHDNIVTELLKNECIDVNIQDHALYTPLHVAVDAASTSILAKLLADKRTDPERLDKRGRSILSLASEYGDTDNVTHILESSRIQVDQKDNVGRTPLSYASQHGHLSIVSKLIETGRADPLSKDDNNRNAHSWAASHESPDVLRYLTKKFPQGTDVPDQDNWAPLAWTLDPPGHPENMVVLLQHGHVNMERTGGAHGRTVLAWAANYRNTKMASILIQERGINLDARDIFGRTPLSEAAGNGSPEIVQLLLATRKVDVNTRDEWGQTPLSWAIQGSHLEVVKLLLSCPGIDTDNQNNSGENALDISRRLDRTEISLELARQMNV